VPVQVLHTALSGVKGLQVAEQGGGNGQRVPAAGAVVARGQGGIAAAGEKRLNDANAHARLVAEHEHEHVAAIIDVLQRGGDRRRAAIAVVRVLHDLDPAQVHPAPHLRRRAAHHAQQLIERAAAGGLGTWPSSGAPP
jgi:hypothetical protein